MLAPAARRSLNKAAVDQAQAVSFANGKDGRKADAKKQLTQMGRRPIDPIQLHVAVRIPARPLCVFAG